MLTINADDWGLNAHTTDNCMACFKNGGITSVSAMVFMEDSVRASAMALDARIPTGLHLNFTKGYDAPGIPAVLNHHHQYVSRYLLGSRYAVVLYNPVLINHFDYVYKAQVDEYVRLYNGIPQHIDGHHHMHLCMNMMIDGTIPRGSRVRRNFTFAPGEKGHFNRFYRSVIDTCLTRRYICTDYFFSLVPIAPGRLQHIMGLAKTADVELMVHPGNKQEYDFILSKAFMNMIADMR